MIRTIIVFLFLLCITVVVKAQDAANSRPNIIFILADDLGYGDIGCNGQQKISTPNIDALAKSGIRFTQFYAGSTVCAPSRASLMTGLHTGHTSVRGNKKMEPEGQAPLPEDAITIAMELKNVGYTTAAMGKWGLGFISTTGSPAHKGFDTFYGYNCQSLAHNYYPDHLWLNEKRIELPENTSQPTTYAPDLVQKEALAFINSQAKEKPFFLYLPYTLPHVDLTPPHDGLYDHYVKLFNEAPLQLTDKRNLNKQFVELNPHAAFAAMVARLDRYVGEVVAAVNRKGIARNTIIIFTSDNGPHREKGGDPEFFNSNGMFRGIKRDLYEGGIRVPLIISWEGNIKEGQQTDHMAAFWDFFPTFQQLAGIPVTQQVDGISIMPILQRKQQPVHDYLYWELHESGGRQAIRWKNWKAIKLNVSTEKANATELYDISLDPEEQHNIAAKYPELVAQLETMMKNAHHKNPEWPLFLSEK